MLEQLMTEIQPLIINLVITIVGAVATYVGVAIKSILKEKQKKKTVETTCRFVNQLYKDLDGAVKFQKAKDVILQLLDEKGIVITELELDVLIESTVYGFKRGYNGTTTLLEVKTPEEVEQTEADNELVG